MEFITSGDRIATENFSIGKIYTVTFTNGNYFINTCVGIGPDFVMFQQEAPKMLFCLDMESAETVSSIDESGGGAGTMNYNELENKPSINGVTLIGNKTAADLSILPVPIVGENDNNKILTASYAGGVGSYSWQPAPSSGTTDYTQLTNKLQINSVELNGNKSLEDLGIASADALAGKQDVISDLNTIRSGAAAGATAVQPATLSGYQTLIDSSHKLSSDLVDDTGHTNKFATAAQLTQIETNKTNISLCYAGITSNLINAPDKTMTATGFVFQEIATKLLANTEYIFYFTIDSKAPMNLVGYTTGQSGRTIDIGILTTQQQIGVNAIKFTPSAQVDTISLYINYQTEDVTYSGMIITQTITAINVIS